MKKRLLSTCLASSLAALAPNQSAAVQAPEPFIELEAMKMFCTVQTDLSQSDSAIVQEISSVMSTPWAVRLHPQASPQLQTRFERILQMVANALGKSVGGFKPGVYPAAEQAAQQTEEIYQASTVGIIDYNFAPKVLSHEDDHSVLIAQGSSNQPPSVGGGFGENAFMGGGIFPSGFASEMPVEVSVSFTAADVFEDLVQAPVELPHQRAIEETVVPAKIAARLSPLPKVSPESVPLKKSQNFLGWLHILAIQNWLKAEVITPLTAAILLLLTPFGGEFQAPKASDIFRRRRRFSLA